MKICFRVDSSSTIGFGHFMRCLTLAKALRARGATCSFVTREHEGALFFMALESGFEVSRLPLMDAPADPDRGQYASWVGAAWDVDAQQTCEAIGSNGVDWIIVDHYGLDHRWERAVREHCTRMMVIDDLADRRHDCDLLLDQNLVADLTTRYNDLVPSTCGLMLGTRFALLQPIYAALRRRVPPREGAIQRVLVYFGGADRHNLTSLSVQALLDLGREDIAIDVVVNSGSPFAPAIRTLTRHWPQVVLHESQKSLAALMAQADVALGAAGTTSWERCCLGLPTLMVTLADNQRPIAAELNRRQLARWIGDVTTITIEDIRQAILAALDQSSSEDWSRRAAQAVDGLGTERVCAYLMLERNLPLVARFAEVDDELLVLEWANDRQSRRNAFSPESISAETHHRWYQARLRDISNCIFLIIVEPSGIPVGQVRFDRKEQGWEISYMLDSRCRGRGLGVPLLKTALDRIAELETDATYLGRVKKDNTPSQRVFERLGFDCEASGEVLTYRLRISEFHPGA